MDDRRARQLLDEERAGLDELEAHLRNQPEESIAAQQAEVWWDDSAELTGELLDADALEELLRTRREALATTEQRFANGSTAVQREAARSSPTSDSKPTRSPPSPRRRPLSISTRDSLDPPPEVRLTLSSGSGACP